MRGVGIARVPPIRAEVVSNGGVICVGAGFGEDFDPSEAQLVVFGGEKILIEPDLADRLLGRELAAAESVDKDFITIGTGRGSGKRLQIRLQVVGVVGERFEVAPGQDRRAGVGRGVRADCRARIRIHRHHGGGGGDSKLQIDRLDTGAQCEVRSRRGKLRGGGRYRIITRRQSDKSIGAVATGDSRFYNTLGAEQRYLRARYNRAGLIGYASIQRRRLGEHARCARHKNNEGSERFHERLTAIHYARQCGHFLCYP